ncbi:Uncharacterized protein OBRU01_09076 [Operophtera brumata]|uniref:Uncharacterized protein n=1 Tax=Operophtera brumata TaxID=104452 RepID=A0A0L7LGF5_OPEBR|nr:Uncharacterized protein OBRU01_09076 [Operophtera brumata]
MHICRTLEISKRLEALYSVQCSSGQNARAAATCALLYSRPLQASACAATLHARQHHLAAAMQHLYRCAPVASTNKTTDTKSFQFNLDKLTIDNLMTTITRQIELAKHLATCEANGTLSEKVLHEVCICYSVISDQVLEAGVSAVVSRCDARGQLHDEQAEILIGDVHSVTVKVPCEDMLRVV